MKRLIPFFILLVVVFAACDFSMPRLTQNDLADSIQIARYDRVQSRYLTTGDFAALQEMNTDYPTQTRALIEDLLKLGSVSEPDINKRLLNYYQDSTLQNVIYAAETKFADMTELNKELQTAFINLRKEIPHMEMPTFYAQVGAFDQSIVVDDKAIGISLDKYLGEDYPTYKRFYDEEQRKAMTPEYIVPDCVIFYILSLYPTKNFDEISQYERDIHLAKLFWIANYVTKKDLLKTPYTDKIGAYMKSHSDMTIDGLLNMRNDYAF